jgi:DNA-3-methyladenine glycosylase I
MRCEWPNNELMIKYHDEEWGVPVHNDTLLFEFLVLETAQAGLSWQTILNRREGYRKAFCNFDYKKVSRFNDEDVERLMLDTSIIRNRLKINSTISNAKLFLEVQREFGSFDKYIWGFVNGKPIVNKFKKLSDIPANTSISNMMSKDLKKRGFKFVGSTICYAFMQAAGLVNDHVVDCFRYQEVQNAISNS